MAARSRIAHPRPWAVRFASFLYLLCPPIAVITLVALICGLWFESELWLQVTVAGVVTLAGTLLGAVAVAHRLNCSVCANPVFLVRKCRKHHRARKFLGISYRLGIATSSLITQRFHCMYCGEKIPLGTAGSKKSSAPASSNQSEESMPAIVSAANELPPRRS